MPPAPADIAGCLRERFPEIPARALTAADVARVIGHAKLLDRAKTGCGNRALAWIEAVRRDFGKL
ncbi:hypothetical protein [Enterovirga rhinocerotis]|uniref:hypothetical protein n=1 Tax=Enterovirga rhinocerotis TaxID=1339210 RepID=UPI00105DA47B|nr:hypothetical protein [Enterovirga rhinocerotis]